ncbi:MAG: Ig-like domain-containing protein [Lachnospiraceae bacterium]|nr:Ig-like domain-containing protein [Lachnospiraceae bacterium]
MKEAVESDLINVTAKPDGSNNIRAHSTQAELLKQQIFKAYLLETNDFSNTIYGDPSPVDPPSPDVTEPDQPGNSGNSGTTTPENPDTGTTTPVNPDTGTGTPGTGTAKPNTGASTAAVTPKLLLCKVSAAKTSHTIRWNAVGSADGYDIYGAKSNGKYERIQTVSKNSVKWTHKKLKKGKSYKYYVQAYQEIGGKRIVIAKSLDVYSTTKGGKYGNASKVSAKKTRISVKAGKKAKLSAKAAGKKLNKTAKKMRYVSSNPSVAKVSSKGIITGKKRGSCTVYCIARNGVYKKIKVTTK